MIAFIVRRLLQATVVMLTVGLISFSLFTYVGDPVLMMVSEEDTAEHREALRERLGLNDAAPIQFGRFILRAAQGDFGVSYRNQRKVGELLAERLPATLELVACSAVFSLLLGIPLGVYTALRRDSPLAHFLQTVSLVGISMPTFLTGILMILVFAVWLNILPSFGRGEIVKIGWWTTGLLTFSGLKALILPAFTLGLFQMTLIMRLVRAEMLEVLRTDFIKFARARGLSRQAIYFGHAIRNTLVPVITITGLQLGSLIAFAIITETVFHWPGMGLLFIQAVRFVDIPVMAAYLMLVALFFVVINLIVDLLYYAVDPRLRVDRATSGGYGK
ncbi:MAG: ABC transporter permease [Alphaproteobacteria bacterium]|nr:ABC transporter permease [Alphaproteobacteria bacterium]